MLVKLIAQELRLLLFINSICPRCWSFFIDVLLQ